MSQIELNTIQEEKRTLSRLFKDISRYALMIGKRHRFYTDVYKKFQRALNTSLCTLPSSEEYKIVNTLNGQSGYLADSENGENCEKIASLGFTVNQAKDILEIYKISDGLINMSKSFSQHIQAEIIDVISDLVSYESDLVGKERAKIRDLRFQRRNAMIAYNTKQKQLTELYDQIEREYKITPVNTIKLKSMLPKYYVLLSSCKEAIADLNYKHSLFVKNIQVSIMKIRVSMVQHVTQIKSMFFMSYPFVIAQAENLDNFIDYVENKRKSWENSFTSFVYGAKIYRVPKPLQSFESYKFSFVDHMIPFPLWSMPCQHPEIPLFIASITHKFEGEGKNEISVEKDEKVFVYEKMAFEWTLIMRPADRTLGYVPTKILTVIEANEMALTTMPHIADNEGQLSFTVNSLLVKRAEKDEENRTFLCENYNNEVRPVFEHEIIIC